LQLKVTASASDNTIARVVRLVEEAQESKAPTERFIDRFSTFYTPAVLVTGLFAAVVPPLLFSSNWHEWIYKGLAILLIGCPCALVISTPAAIASSLSNGARRGLLIKGGAALEGLAKITTAAIDKTGTLTEGKPKVTDVIAVNGNESDVISLAAALEIGSGHPLAGAILAKAEEGGRMVMAAQNVTSVGGKGVAGNYFGKALFLGSVAAAGEKATISPELAKQIEALQNGGKTVSVLISEAQVTGIIAMRDQPRADVKQGLQALRDARISVVMLTGDNARVANVMAKELGIAVRSELLPGQKLQIVKELQRVGQKVVKVGDGINDAPALAAADIGIAMGGGTDVALETADAAILHERVTDIAEIIKLAKATMANIRQNITIALGLKLVFLVTTIIGITGLWPAILADTGATVLVTANAMRLLKSK
jgi:Zn2+/Cd2+-exporting ATPase